MHLQIAVSLRMLLHLMFIFGKISLADIKFT